MSSGVRIRVTAAIFSSMPCGSLMPAARMALTRSTCSLTLLRKTSAMKAADLRELASQLPSPTGPQANLPTLQGYLPKDDLVPNSTRYVAGPEGFNRLAAPLSNTVIDFNRGAEVVQARYRLDDNAADLLLISYPTPQIAAERAKAIEAAASQEGQQGIAVRRSGPIVAVANDPASPRDARSLAAAMHYDANVTWNE